jgi:hypothetical protein
MKDANVRTANVHQDRVIVENEYEQWIIEEHLSLFSFSLSYCIHHFKKLE